MSQDLEIYLQMQYKKNSWPPSILSEICCFKAFPDAFTPSPNDTQVSHSALKYLPTNCNIRAPLAASLSTPVAAPSYNNPSLFMALKYLLNNCDICMPDPSPNTSPVLSVDLLPTGSEKYWGLGVAIYNTSLSSRHEIYSILL